MYQLAAHTVSGCKVPQVAFNVSSRLDVSRKDQHEADTYRTRSVLRKDTVADPQSDQRSHRALRRMIRLRHWQNEMASDGRLEILLPTIAVSLVSFKFNLRNGRESTHPVSLPHQNSSRIGLL